MLIGLMYSRAMLSMGQIALAACFLLEGHWREKWNLFRRNKIAILLSGLFLIHILGLIYTSNHSYAMDDLRIKLPILLFPVIFSSTSFLSKDLFRKLNLLFVFLVLSKTLIIAGNYFVNREGMTDLRDAFLGMSHIRFSLMVTLAIVLTLYYVRDLNRPVFALGLLLCIYFLWFFLYFELITGLVVSIFVIPLALALIGSGNGEVQFHFRAGSWALGTVILAGLIYITVVGVKFSEKQAIVNVDDEVRTSSGRPYNQIYKWGKGLNIRENGYLVYQNVSLDELQDAWNSRSNLKIDYFDTNYTNTEAVLVRYLASKGLTKDSAGIAGLSDEDVAAIEAGKPNVLYLHRLGFEMRIMETVWEIHNYFNGGAFNGHSLAMRFEFWKTGWQAWMRHFLLGVGTGDVEDVMHEQYDLNQSRLSEDWRFLPHNQFITTGLGLGVLGAGYLLISMVLPMVLKRRDYFVICFMSIAIISMLAENTLGTQIGVAFFAFFNSFYYFRSG